MYTSVLTIFFLFVSDWVRAPLHTTLPSAPPLHSSKRALTPPPHHPSESNLLAIHAFANTAQILRPPLFTINIVSL